VKQADQTVVVPPGHLYPTPSVFVQLWRIQKTEDDPDDPETSDKEKSKLNTPLVSFAAHV
jgi:hypothetical protein